MSKENKEYGSKSAKRPKKGTAKNPRPDGDAEIMAAEAPAPAEPTAMAPSSHGGVKRSKRRRGKKGKGAGETKPAEDDLDDSEAPATTVQLSGDDKGDADSRPPEKSRKPRHDPSELSRMAWKIFLAEVSEEGIALLGDQDAREIAQRCFRLAELFLNEQARHR